VPRPLAPEPAGGGAVLPRVEPHLQGAVVDVWVQPRAKRPGVVGVRQGALHLKVAAPPEDGRANDEVCRLLAEALGVRARDVRIVGGARSRAKRALVAGMDAGRAARALAALAAAAAGRGTPGAG